MLRNFRTSSAWLGRTIKVEKPSFTGTNLTQTFAYNNKGQLISEGSLEGAVKLQADKLHDYDELGNPVRTGSDIDGNGSLSAASTDRLVESEIIHEKTGNDWFRVATTKNYFVNNSATAMLQTRRERLTNFPISGAEKTFSDVVDIDVTGNSTRATIAVDRAAKKVTETKDTPDSSTNAVRISVNGLLQSTTPTTPESATTFAYDALARPSGTTSPRTGTTTRAYHATTGQLISTSDAVGSTTYEYYPATHSNAGRLKSQTNAAGKKAYFNYNSRGELAQTWGETAYPLEYVFDGYGQRTELHTFRGGSGWQLSNWPSGSTGTADLTRWIYHEPTGLLQQKRDAVNQGANYTHDAMGRLRTRTWARPSGGNPLVTTYSFDSNTTDLTQIDYSDTTPDVIFTSYDRAGRPTNLSDAAGSHTLAYNSNGELQGDQISGGILDGVNVAAGYDGFLRRNDLQASRNAVGLMSQSYGYDSSSRLQTITGSGQTVTYGYNPTRGLLETTIYSSGTNMTRGYDGLGRLQTITTTPPASPAISYTYTYNNLHQRTRVTREDSSYWSYGYNDRGEVTSGKKYWVDNSPVAGMQFEYGFDNLGNRNSAKSGGNSQGGGLRESTYLANSLNQYTQHTVPGAVDIVGTANATATVTVNNQTTGRTGVYFHKALELDNSVAPIYSAVDVVGVKSGAGPAGEDAVVLKTGSVYVPKTPEPFTHDADGNLTSDGRWTYTWDAENRLVAMEAIASVPAAAKMKLEFAYDFQGRRMQKIVYSWNVSSSSYQLQSTTRFVYGGWNLVAELDVNNNLSRSYVWGQDLKGEFKDSGGIGALLLLNEAGNGFAPINDGRGNVTGILRTDTGERVASYEYTPFAETLEESGEDAAKNRFRFSTKYTDGESTAFNYGHRYYYSATGRWMSRDPLEDRGGTNLYGFLTNNPASFIDELGLRKISMEFNAFIPLRLGRWFPEPVPQLPLSLASTWEYNGNWRGFGGGESKVKVTAEVESKDIGRMGSSIVHTKAAGPSIRRRIKFNPWSNHYEEEQTQATVYGRVYAENKDRGQTWVIFDQIGAAYPFYDFSPAINFSVIWKLRCQDSKHVSVVLAGTHNLFPDYEGLLDQASFYRFSTSDSGPTLINLNRWTPISPQPTRIIEADTK